MELWRYRLHCSRYRLSSSELAPSKIQCRPGIFDSSLGLDLRPRPSHACVRMCYVLTLPHRFDSHESSLGFASFRFDRIESMRTYRSASNRSIDCSIERFFAAARNYFPAAEKNNFHRHQFDFIEFLPLQIFLLPSPVLHCGPLPSLSGPNPAPSGPNLPRPGHCLRQFFVPGPPTLAGPSKMAPPSYLMPFLRSLRSLSQGRCPHFAISPTVEIARSVASGFALCLRHYLFLSQLEERAMPPMVGTLFLLRHEESPSISGTSPSISVEREILLTSFGGSASVKSFLGALGRKPNCWKQASLGLPFIRASSNECQSNCSNDCVSCRRQDA